MIISITLYPGTALTNVRYFWIAAGVEGPELSSGITQPDTDRPVFRFDVTPPDSAEQIIAYDVTAPDTNWNVGLVAVIGSLPVEVPVSAPPGLRVTRFKSVFDSVLRQLGFDPVGDAISHDTARAVTEQINTAVLYAWRYWEWPQLELLQERAYRTVWTNTLQFRKVGFEGNPDEFYYGPIQLPPGAEDPGIPLPEERGYYRVKSTAPADPLPGTVPTDTVYFQKFDITDCYLALDQVNQTPIGEAIEIFRSDPRLTTAHDANRVLFQPTEREITVIDFAGPTVFLLFRIIPSEFTMVPYIPGKDYAVGNLVYNPVDGDCYRCMVAIPVAPGTLQPLDWVKVPFPASFAQYVTMAAFAACLGESRADKSQMDVQRAAAASQAADEAIAQEVDRLRAQGQHYRYKRWRVPSNDPYWWSYPAVSPNAV